MTDDINLYYHPDGDDQTIAHNKFMECVLIFHTDNEKGKDEFKKFISRNWKDKQKYNRRTIF
ncbi:MAG: hypothetical protein RR261_07165 [Oscillospiraceae bacterium]